MVTKKGDTMYYRIYQMQLIFKYQDEHKEDHCLIYVKYFPYTSSKKHDAETGMWVVENTDNYEVVPASSVMYSVHLVSFFDSQSSISSWENQDWDFYSFKYYLVNCYSDSYAFKNFG